MKPLSFVGRVSALAILVLALAAGAARAQTGTGSIYGEVKDPKGLGVVGAKVTLTNVETKATRTGETDSTGVYLFPALPPGKYSLRVEMAGFRAYLRPNIELLVNTTVKANVQLELGAVSEIVQVIESAAALNTTDASMGNVVTPQQVESLPLLARNPVALLTLQAGVAFSGDPTDPRSGSVNGGRSDQANVTLDGVDVNDQQTQNALSTSLQIPLESIQEFRFTTSNPNADQGRSSGGQVAFVTKSGTNEFHGAAFWTHRNTVTTANDFFNNLTTPPLPVPKLLRNQFGGSAGGPFIKERFFFFFTYEGNRRREEFNELRVVPTDSLRDGVLIYRCAVAADCPGGTVAGLAKTFTVPAGHFGLTPANLKTVDPLNATNPAAAGVNPAMVTVLRGFPTCNDFTQGLDATGTAPGLNFCGFRFNSPIALRNNVYVAKLDYHITHDARHVIFWRGTLGNVNAGLTPQQFPGQPTAQVLLDNSKGYVVSYTGQILRKLTAVVRYGYTRQGSEITGQRGDALSIRNFSLPFSAARGTSRIIPTHNLTADLSWVRGTHTFTFGENIRWIRNDRVTFANSFALYAINDGFCAGLCNSVPNSLGSGALAAFPRVAATGPRAFRNPFKRALMALYGNMTQIGSAFIFDGTANKLASGQGVARRFQVNEYEFYGQDTWRMFRNFTLTFGLRYGYYGVPFESNGFQVQPTVDIQAWFESRRQAMNAGLPQSGIPLLSWERSGPANGKPGFYRPDKNNFAPNVSFAYSPGFQSGWLAKIMGAPGKTVIRGGGRVVYDRIGGAFVVSQDLTGAVGLVTNVINTTGVLDYGGSACTAPPTARCAAPRFSGFGRLPPVTNFVFTPRAGFPQTPPADFSSLGFIIDNRLRTPYSYGFDLSYARELRGGISVETAYVTRLGHKLLTKADLGAPAIYLRDPASGTTYADAINRLYDLSGQGDVPILPLSRGCPAIVNALRPITPVPYFQNLFPDITGFPCPGMTATQAVYWIGGPAFPSFTDTLNAIEGLSRLSLGDFTFFQPQFASLPAWTNLGGSNYHALQLTVRKRLSHGLQFDFNYTFSKSIDNASAVENSGRLTGQIADAFFPRNGRSASSFDLRHQMSANWIYELPFGRGRWLAHDVPGWVNQVIGGWQTSGIIRWRGAFPFALENGFNFPTNFFLTGPGTQTCPMPTNLLRNSPPGVGPRLFGDSTQTAAARACLDFTRAGSAGSRNSLRGARFFNLDFGLRKSFSVLGERHKLIFDWQVFNLANRANFDDRTMRTNPEAPLINFGRYVSTIGGDERANQARSMQFGLRYQF